MQRHPFLISAAATLVLALSACSGGGEKHGNAVEITNVSYDPTRELYQAINPTFAAFWKQKTGQEVVQAAHIIHLVVSAKRSRCSGLCNRSLPSAGTLSLIRYGITER